MTRPLAARALSPLDPPLEADVRRAEGLLHDLAGELRLVPLEGRTQPLHVRALGLKREVSRWRFDLVTEAERRDVIEELLALHDQAQAWRQRLRSGDQLAHASSTWPRVRVK